MMSSVSIEVKAGRQALFVNADPTDQDHSSKETRNDGGKGATMVGYQIILTSSHVFYSTAHRQDVVARYNIHLGTSMEYF